MNISLKIQRERKVKLTNKEKKIVATITKMGFQSIEQQITPNKQEILFVFSDEKYKPEILKKEPEKKVYSWTS